MDYLTGLSDALISRFGRVLPGVLGALAVLIIGFFIAGIVKRITKKLLSKTSIDERIGSKLGAGYRLDSFIAKLMYYLVVIYTLIIVLNMLGVNNVLEPLQNMVNEFIGFLPNVIAAGIIAFAGYVLSKLGSEATGFVSERLETFGSKMGVTSDVVDLTKIVKQIVFLLIFIPILIIALDTLNMKVISEPATEMLSKFLNAIPQIIGAALLLGVFFIVGRYITTFLADILNNMGLDKMSTQLGIGEIIGNRSISKIIGNIVFFFIIFTGLIAAADKLGLLEVQTILRDIFDIAGKVFFGIVIILAGVFISNVAIGALSKSSANGWTIPITRFAIMGIFLAFSLHTMGIAESIVNLAFGLTLGAIAVAFALSFGLGGREAAGKQMEEFFNKIKE